MNIIAFVENESNDGSVSVAKNGELCEDDKISEIMPEIESILKKFKNRKNMQYFNYQNKNVFLGIHRLKDNLSRKREFVLYWDSNDKELIQKTASLIGITKNEFDLDNLPKQEKNFSITTIILILGLILLLSMILLKK